ncbi:MAG: PilZ domain-containing protein [Candidatus Omnitrophica bacterium]|nr:PilZ domain-containing protein [Candidatus Omnitrophota bacterium]
MGNWDGLDRRKFPRVKYPCLVIIKNGEGDDKEVILSHTENIGIGGVCVILKKNIKMFTQVEIELDLLDMGDHIKCNGKIVWNVQRKSDAKKKPLFYDVGVEFESLPDDDKKRIEDVVSRLVRHDREVPYT